tara:strand:+ start:6115 stop:6690 length:576 start_codon:yes stop_codon:yes gene_type:complete
MQDQKANMNAFIKVVSWSFGLLLIGFSVFVSLETISRKLFDFSFQGADELGGYILAVCGSLAFSLALLERGHVRIDFIYDRLSRKSRSVLNWLSVMCMAAVGLFFARYCYVVIRDTISYGSTAATPWATPLIYPQSLWYAALLIFTLTSLGLAIWVTVWLCQGKNHQINQHFGPKSSMEELQDELTDIQQR